MLLDASHFAPRAVACSLTLFFYTPLSWQNNRRQSLRVTCPSCKRDCPSRHPSHRPRAVNMALNYVTFNQDYSHLAVGMPASQDLSSESLS